MQANGLPSGAQQVPVTVPCGDVKLHSFPLLSDLHEARASVDGLGGPFPSEVCADKTPHIASAATLTAWRKNLPKGKEKQSLEFIELVLFEWHAPALPN